MKPYLRCDCEDTGYQFRYGLAIVSNNKALAVVDQPPPKEPPAAMTSALEPRKVHTQTAGQVTVTQRNLSLDDLREFVQLADVHGVEGSTVVNVTDSYNYDQTVQGNVHETTLSVPAPVVFAFGSTTVGKKHPRVLRRERMAKKTAVTVGIGALLLSPLMLALDLLWKLFRFALGWL
jgi:hypothetical protein